MSNYTPLTNFGAKDTLPSGNAAKVVRGSEFTIEFNNIASSIATKAEVNAPSFTSNATFGGNIVVSGTVDGRDVATDGTKLDTVEASATADQTAGEIRALVESASNSHVFTDADHTKLNAIEASADVTDTANVTTAGAAMLTGASFTGNVSTTGTLATGGFTLPATDGTVGQALLTNGSGAVAWGDVTVDITGKANLSGAVFTGGVSIGSLPSNAENFSVTGVTTLYNGANVTGNISLDSNAVYLSNYNDIGGKGRIGIGTSNPLQHLDIVQSTDAYMRLAVPTTRFGELLFYNTTENYKAGSVRGYLGGTTGYVELNAWAKNNSTPANYLRVSTTNTFSEKPFTNSGNPQDNTGHFTYNNPSSELVTQTAFGVKNARSYNSFGDMWVLRLKDGSNFTKGGLVTDEDGKLGLLDYTSEKGVTVSGTSFMPFAVQDLSFQGGVYERLMGHQASADTTLNLGTTSNRWSTIYLSNQPNVSSDQRLKQNIEDADDAGSTIDAIQVRKFDWIEGGKHQSYGMIAQELAEVYPEAVSVPENEEDTLGIATGDLIPMLIKEVQSLRSRVAELENV
jgi:hypothetical protein